MVDVFFLHNFVKASDENGGPLSVDSILGGPYCEIIDLVPWVNDSAAFN